VAFPYYVPGNVGQTIHIYRSRWRLYPARPLQSAPGSHERIENIDLDQKGAPLQERWLHHLNFTARPSVQDWIMSRIVKSI
jgi:hypothetical protein